jgi:hypothetical protein
LKTAVVRRACVRGRARGAVAPQRRAAPALGVMGASSRREVGSGASRAVDPGRTLSSR